MPFDARPEKQSVQHRNISNVYGLTLEENLDLLLTPAVTDVVLVR